MNKKEIKNGVLSIIKEQCVNSATSDEERNWLEQEMLEHSVHGFFWVPEELNKYIENGAFWSHEVIISDDTNLIWLNYPHDIFIIDGQAYETICSSIDLKTIEKEALEKEKAVIVLK